MTKVMTKKKIYTVSELTRDIRLILEEKFTNIWVEGEVSNFTRHQSGHMYFSLKDKDSVLSAVLFRSVGSSLKFQIKNGMHVLCGGRISVYDKRGQYQLYANNIEPKGAGALQIAFEQLKEKLRKEGLFDEAVKKPVPYLPQCVGVITSPTGAAIKDILNVAKRRYSNIEVILAPVRVQGSGAEHEIARAIEVFNEYKKIDVIIITRGGGSLEDLWPFNEEIVARAIRASGIPIISAVGHEIDWTISDFASDKRAPTPSAAAELVIPRKEDLASNLTSLSERMRSSVLSKLQFLNDKLDGLKKRYVLREPFNVVNQYAQEVDDLASQLAVKGEFILKIKNEFLKTLAGKLHVLSPLGILARGYSITTLERTGRILKDAKLLIKNDILKTKLARGNVRSKIVDTEATLL